MNRGKDGLTDIAHGNKINVKGRSIIISLRNLNASKYLWLKQENYTNSISLEKGSLLHTFPGSLRDKRKIDE